MQRLKFTFNARSLAVVILVLLVRAASAQAPAPAKAADGRKVMVVFGDSISAGFGLNRGESFPDRLQKRIDAENLAWRVVNMGISGDTTMGGLSRVKYAVRQNPSLVLIELGGNDGLRGTPVSITKANLEKLIQEFQGAGARVVLAGMTLPPNYGSDFVKGFEGVYKDLASQYKLTLIPFLLSDMITKDLRYFQHDGIHPTAEGAEIVSSTVFKAVKPLLR